MKAEEKKHLKLYVEYAAIATSYWNFWKFNIDTPLPEKASLHWQAAKLANAVRDTPQHVFSED